MRGSDVPAVELEFPKPRNRRYAPVDWRISEQVRTVIKAYAEYLECSEGEAVDEFLRLNIRKDPGFLKWVQDRRYNLRLMLALFPEKEAELRLQDRMRKSSARRQELKADAS